MSGFEESIIDYMKLKGCPLSYKNILSYLKSNSDYKIKKKHVLGFLKKSDCIRQVNPYDVGCNKATVNVFVLTT